MVRVHAPSTNLCMKQEQNNDRRLLFSVTANDCKWEYFKGQGKGGQKRNKTENCCRCIHLPSKAVGIGQRGRSKYQNRKTAFMQMINSKEFKNWHRIETARQLETLVEVERAVEKQMHSKNLKVEIKDSNNKWIDASMVE